MKRERIGVFGGSFDPVHRVHLGLAHGALDALQLDRVLWIPAGQPWQKSRPMTGAVHRLAMLRLALQGEPRFEIDRREIDRAGPSYTVDTVAALRAEHPDAGLYLLIGADQYAAFHTWHRWREIARQVQLAVASRAGAPGTADPEVQALCSVCPVPLAPSDLAATAVRERVAQGQGIADLVPDEVARYIDLHGLYRAVPSRPDGHDPDSRS